MKDAKKLKESSMRPPIVVVLGHVDHGKTTLLDYIRKTNVAGKEEGGITQSIGASIIATKAGKEITFIDTPGHAAFSNMRLRGAKVADIAVLVVAADDGVKPQTKEALEYILDTKVPFVVAASKIDLPTASPDTVRDQLEKEGVSFEGRGGEVPFVSVSGKTGKGVDELLEVIGLVSELHEVKGDPGHNLEAVVIETERDKKGPSATLVVRDGSLKVGDEIIADKFSAKVRGLFDHLGKPIKKVGPGKPALMLGFSQLPAIGSGVWIKKDASAVSSVQHKPITKVEFKEDKVNIVIKAASSGSLEAILNNISKEVNVIDSGVGDVKESDVFMAKSGSAEIFAFESKIPPHVSKLAETEGVSVKTFGIIYKLFERVGELVKKEEVEVLAEAKIKASFPYNGKKVAGCKVLRGKIDKDDTLILKRGDVELGKVKIESMKKQKQDIREAKQGEECGILFGPQLDFREGDMLLSVRKS